MAAAGASNGGGFQIDWTRFEDHWHLQIMWAAPLERDDK